MVNKFGALLKNSFVLHTVFPYLCSNLYENSVIYDRELFGR